MKNVIKGCAVILVLSTHAWAGGPLFSHNPTEVDQEFRNVYQDIKNPIINYATISSATVSYMSVSSATMSTTTFNGMAIFNSTVSLRNVLIANGSAGASGQVLASQGNAASPIWTAISSSLFIQAVSTTSAATTSTTSTSFVNTNLQQSITLASSSSRVLVLVSGDLTNTNGNRDAIATLARGGSNLVGTRGLALLAATGSTPASFVYLDSPGASGSVSYAVQIRISNSDTTVQWGQNDGTNILKSWMILIELAS